MITRVKNTEEIAAMRESGAMLGAVLGLLRQKIGAGITTKELSDIAAEELKKLGGKPAFLGYYGFPEVLCVSINDEVVHGIPSTNVAVDKGDVVSMDFGVTYRGMITDAATTVIIGEPKSEEVAKLVQKTEQALMAGIDTVRDGVHTGDIGSAVQSVLEPARLGIVRDYVGHGVGHHLHEEPNVPNYGHKGQGPTLKAGMTIAIEPMATLGTHNVIVGRDGWTVMTADGSLSAHFEHTVLIGRDGPEILTLIPQTAKA